MMDLDRNQVLNIYIIYIGAYIFRSKGKTASILNHQLKTTQLFKSDTLSQISLLYDKSIIHIRLFKHKRFGFEVESVILPRALEYGERGMEFILSILTDFNNQNGIYIYIYNYK